MSKAQNGQQMFLEDALKLVDKNGDVIKFEEQDDGSYTAKIEEKGTKDADGKALPGHTYTYSLTPRPQIVDVVVIEEVEGAPKEGPQPEDAKQTEEVKKQAEIEKSIDSNKTKSKKF